MLDIERLHKIVYKINNCHALDVQEGTTTAYLHLMMGEVWLGSRENQYVYIGRDTNHINQVCLQFLSMLTEDNQTSEFPKKDIKVLHRSDGYHVIINEQSFVFITYLKANEPIFWCNRHFDRVFIDLNEYNSLLHLDIIQTIVAFGGDIL